MSACCYLSRAPSHTYDIHYKFRWQCANDWCGRVYGRHSNSIDTSKQGCGICSGKLTFLGKFNADGTPCKPKAASKFSLYVKENYKRTKQGLGAGADHAQVMKVLSQKWSEQKGANSETGVESLIARFTKL